MTRKSLIAILVLSSLGTQADFQISDALLGTHRSEAWAVVGRPLTPGSYAGVARRTSRRTARRTAARVSGVNTITALPAGCVGTLYGGISYHNCGGVYYQPSYQGTTVVYVEVEDPHTTAPSPEASDQPS